jgi:hypothetical protein
LSSARISSNSILLASSPGCQRPTDTDADATYSPRPPGHAAQCGQKRAALPARRIGESPRLVGAVALVYGCDLAGGQRDPGEHPAHLAARPHRAHQQGTHLLAPLAGLGDLGEVLVALDLELALPQLTVDVEHLVDRQPVTVLEDPP